MKKTAKAVHAITIHVDRIGVSDVTIRVECGGVTREFLSLISGDSVEVRPTLSVELADFAFSIQ